MARKDTSLEVEKVTPKKRLVELANLADSVKGKKDAHSEQLSKAVRSNVENHHLHAGAFHLCARLRRMDPLKLRSWLDSFDAYRDSLELDNKKATDLFISEAAEAEQAEEDEGGAGEGKPGGEGITSLEQRRHERKGRDTRTAADAAEKTSTSGKPN